MKTTIMIPMERELLRQVRTLAADEGVPVSDLLASYVRQLVCERRDYRQARKRAVAGARQGFDLRWTRPGSRDGLHQR
jgi:hypothetical protein